jgi:hypothetical protein
MQMSEPENLAQCPHNNKELNRDSYLCPAIFSHGENCSWMGVHPDERKTDKTRTLAEKRESQMVQRYLKQSANELARRSHPRDRHHRLNRGDRIEWEPEPLPLLISTP